ncbi:MAG: Gfo/Idh/MocA family oxidoreductase [Pirellulaceae bacterium]|nr:Gfo/Idh/MocA family oxidoreductase [Pirellulaceae bacterium]
MTVRFGIIGCGMISEFHAKALQDLEQAELVGAASRAKSSAADFAETHGIRAFQSIDELIESNEIDAVSICSPSGAHLEAALKAAAAGKHVVIEKPLEITLERCDQIIEACASAGVVLSTIFQSRFHESCQVLKQAVDEGRFGTLTLANAYVKWFRTQDYYDSGAWRGTWELDGGGALMNQAIHNVDLLQWMMGPLQEISAFTSTLSHERIEVEDTAVATVRFANGALGTIEATTSAWPGSLKRLEIYGSTGSAILEDANILKWEFEDSDAADKEILARFAARNTTEGGASDPSAIDYSGHRAQFADVIEAIQQKRRPLIDGEEARKSVQIIRAIYDSAKNGRTIRLD